MSPNKQIVFFLFLLLLFFFGDNVNSVTKVHLLSASEKKKKNTFEGVCVCGA